VAITRPKLGSSTKPESTHPRNLRSNNKAFNEAVNNLPAELKKELKKDRTLMNRFKEMWNSMGFTSAAAKEKEIRKILKDYPPLSKKELPKGKGSTEALFSLGRSKYKPKSTKLTEIVVKSKSSVKDVAPLGKGGKGGTRRIKSGDTLSAIARRNNTTVAALMKLNPKIKDKDKIKAGDTINVGNPKTEAFRIKEKKRSGTTDPARTIAEAKRRGLTTYTPKGSNTPKAAVTAAELKKSGLSLRAYLNKMKKKKK
jgi:LysM repeat protein